LSILKVTEQYDISYYDLSCGSDSISVYEGICCTTFDGLGDSTKHYARYS